ncbi:MAG: hypothetical protein N4A54_00510 [Peptostreptococcaceae bacterium]|jgi:hypothetical protein|nr:hypothetical protein [Peptostreptococcaceae bacterium]
MSEIKFKKYEYHHEDQMKKYGNYYEMMGSVVIGPHSEQIVKVHPKRGHRKLDKVRNLELFLKSADGDYEMFIQGFSYGDTIIVNGPYRTPNDNQAQASWMVNEQTPIVGEGFIHGESYLRGTIRRGGSLCSTILGADIKSRIKGVKLLRIDIDGDVLKLVYRNETGDRVNPMFLLRGYGF